MSALPVFHRGFDNKVIRVSFALRVPTIMCGRLPSVEQCRSVLGRFDHPDARLCLMRSLREPVVNLRARDFSRRDVFRLSKPQGCRNESDIKPADQ